MKLLPADRRRAAEFARLLERLDHDLTNHPTAVAAGRVAQAAGSNPEMASLLTLTAALPRPDVELSVQSREQMRRRLVAMAAVSVPMQQGHGVVRPAPNRLDATIAAWWADGRRQGRLAVAAGVAVVLLMAAAVGLAGDRSLPGDPFFGIKRATEAVQLSMTRGDLAHGTVHFRFAATRLTEIHQLLARDGGLAATSVSTHPLAGGMTLSPGTASNVVRAFADMDRETAAGTRDLTRAWKSSGAPQPLELLSTFSSEQSRQLEQTLPELPKHALGPAHTSLSLLVLVSHTADELHKMVGCDARCRAKTAPPTLVPSPITLSALELGAGAKPSPQTSALLAQLKASLVAYSPQVTPADPAPAPPSVLPSSPASPAPSNLPPALSPSPLPSPTYVESPSESPSLSPTPDTVLPSPSETPAPSPSGSPSESPAPSESATPSTTPSPSATPSPSSTPSMSPSPSPLSSEPAPTPTTSLSPVPPTATTSPSGTPQPESTQSSGAPTPSAAMSASTPSPHPSTGRTQ